MADCIPIIGRHLSQRDKYIVLILSYFAEYFGGAAPGHQISNIDNARYCQKIIDPRHTVPAFIVPLSIGLHAA